MRLSKSIILLSIFCLLTAGCAQKKRRKTIIKKAPGQTTVVEEETVEGADSTEVEEDPPTKIKRKATVALVFGGVGVASWATVGVLKRFEQSDLKLNCVVATGWPAMFALGFGFFRTIHDLEWFSRRLKQTDFYKKGFFDFNKGYHDNSQLRRTLQRAFKGKNALGQTRIPTIISASYPQEAQPTAYRSGPWLNPVLKAMSTPGIYRPLQTTRSSRPVRWSHSLVGVDVGEATNCKADFIVAIDMYADYFQWLTDNARKQDDSESVFRQLYVTQFEQTLKREIKTAAFSRSIRLRKSPLDFSLKLGAIREGYKQADQIISQIQNAELP